MRDLETRHEKLEAERNNQLDLIGKLKTMEEKMLKGNEVGRRIEIEIDSY